ncbi:MULTISPECIES: hypothetical protein [Citrobacter freundii complex]|nr:MULTISPECIES: hypothetical protein [Citrobacter freundii complex]ELQ8288043.1 hypothetical protein [Escherichia coli]MBJ8815657.1 hypothetical protein [Citrobacter freundii]NSL36987.1 hypothetical protein [Citrobacter werkmanii]OYQ92233.1 hypothetical protein B9P86_26695 [Citrobacter freundii]HAT3761176.1 hypothetical protein [Citrobacter freundii]
MQELEGAPLHQSILGGIRIECPAELTATMKDYFKSNGFDVGNTVCFSNNAPDKLNLIFEVATQARKLAEVIMGLLNRNDVEIELNLCTRDDLPQTAKLKLRSLKDREECERLIKNLASVVVKPTQDDQ